MIFSCLFPSLCIVQYLGPTARLSVEAVAGRDVCKANDRNPTAAETNALPLFDLNTAASFLHLGRVPKAEFLMESSPFHSMSHVVETFRKEYEAADPLSDLVSLRRWSVPQPSRDTNDTKNSTRTKNEADDHLNSFASCGYHLSRNTCRHTIRPWYLGRDATAAGQPEPSPRSD